MFFTSFSMFADAPIDPAMLMNYMPDSQVNQNDPQSIARNFQAQLIKTMFLEPSFGKQMSLLSEDDNDMLGSVDTEYVNQLIMHNMAQDFAKKDLLKLQKVLTKGMSL